MVRQGVAIDSLPKTPFILGSECAGEIEQVGEGVDKFKVWDMGNHCIEDWDGVLPLPYVGRKKTEVAS